MELIRGKIGTRTRALRRCVLNAQEKDLSYGSMAAPSDAVVIGIILTLVFSAAIYYIHTLLQQLEGKVNVLNTIIFELKKTNEQYMNMYEGGGYESAPLEPFSMTGPYETQSMEKDTLPQKEFVPAEAPTAAEAEGIYMDFDIGDIPATTTVAEKKAPSDEPSTSLLSVNYESMTYKELKGEAKRRHIPRHSNLSKQELIDALKQLDAGTEVSGITSEGGFQSIASVEGEAEEYIPNFEDVINLN